MALGGTIRGKKTTLRLPVEADLETYNRWMADMRVRRAHSVWHEPAMPATWKERFKEIAKEKMDVLWSIDSDDRLVGFATGSFWSVTELGFTLRQFLIDPDEWRKGYGFDAALALHRYLFDYLNLPRVGVEVRADNVAALRIAERLGYVEYARGHEVYYRDGAYVDEIQLFMGKDAWNERWGATEREYASPLAADATR
jgi:RimJ/RimL family protein N-acetyltransferase